MLFCMMQMMISLPFQDPVLTGEPRAHEALDQLPTCKVLMASNRTPFAFS